MGQRIIITGAAGFIGSGLVARCLQLGHKVSAVVRPTTNLWRLRHLTRDLNLITGDLAKEPDLIQRMADFKPDVIFHSAMHSGYHPADPQARWDNAADSVLGMQTALEAALQSNAKLVFLGSSTVYARSSQPLTEDSTVDPVTTRGAAKAAAAILFRQFARQHALNSVELRLFTVYGEKEGDSRLIPTALKCAASGEQMQLTPWPHRDYVYLEEVLDACLLAATKTTSHGEVIHIGSGVQHSNAEVVKLVEQATGRQIHVTGAEHAGRPLDSPHWVADIAKAERLLGWKPRFSLLEGLQDLWQRMNNRGTPN
jgi:nucleoside-diphosphate-sugar epimerase